VLLEIKKTIPNFPLFLGIAYVKFSKTSEAAAAMEALDGKHVGNGPRPIKVLIAHR